MRIKKMYQSALPEGSVLNTHSDSRVNTYSSDYLNQHFEGVELYNNSTGSTGNITLSDSVENYNYVEIFYRNGDNVYGYTKIDKGSSFTNKKIALSFNNYNTGVSAFQFWATEISLSGTTLTHTKDYYYDGTAHEINYIYVYKVIGYK